MLTLLLCPVCAAEQRRRPGRSVGHHAHQPVHEPAQPRSTTRVLRALLLTSKKDVRYPPPRPSIIRTTRPAALQCLAPFLFVSRHPRNPSSLPLCSLPLSLLSCTPHLFTIVMCSAYPRSSRATRKSVGKWSSGVGRKLKLALKKRPQTKSPIDAEKDRIPIENSLGLNRGFSLVGRPPPWRLRASS